MKKVITVDIFFAHKSIYIGSPLYLWKKIS